MTSNKTPHKLIRSCLLFLPLLLLLSGVQNAFAQAAQALNLSTRMLVGTGDEVAIAGFILQGPAATQKHVVVRALGPSLAPQVPNVMADPVLELNGPASFTTIINNDYVPGITNPPGDPGNSRESAIDVTLDSGNEVLYTAIVRGNGSTTLGIGLVEIYDIPPHSGGKLANISTRAFVSTGDEIVIAGFILGNGTGDDNIIVRGIGPSLPASLPNRLADPTLELRDANGTLIAENDNWQDDQTQADIISMAQLALPQPLESGIAAGMLAPGTYTALLAGKNNTTGIGLVEVYDGVP